MSKKIDSALKDLKKALTKHAEVVGAPAVSLKKSQRASAKVAAAADAYAAAVLHKSGMSNPFTGMETLEAATLASLSAERDALKNRRTGPIDIAS